MVRGDLVVTPGTVTAEAAPIERVVDFKYMGSYFGWVTRDIDQRCKAAPRVYGHLCVEGTPSKKPATDCETGEQTDT
jgi:hypothetical protein